MEEVDGEVAKELYQTVDGMGHSFHAKVPHLHSWVADGSRLMSGRGYIDAVQVRCNTLYTEGRASRGRAGRATSCEVCGAYESLGHILQTCARTWAPRSKRHDCIVAKVAKQLSEIGYEVLKEARVPTRAGIRIPDVVAMLSNQAWAIDVNSNF